MKYNNYYKIPWHESPSRADYQLIAEHMSIQSMKEEMMCGQHNNFIITDFLDYHHKSLGTQNCIILHYNMYYFHFTLQEPC